MKNCYENRPNFPQSMPGFLCLNPLTVRKSKMLMVRLGFKKIMRQGKELGCDTGRPGKKIRIQSSVQFSHSVMSNSLQPHELQHARPPCPSPTPGVHSNSHPSSRWCHPAISSSVVPFSPAPNPSQHQSLFQWVNSSHEVTKYWSFSFSISLSNEHPGLISFRMEWLDLLAVQGTVQKHQFFSAQLSSQSNSHIHTGPLEKP